MTDRFINDRILPYDPEDPWKDQVEKWNKENPETVWPTALLSSVGWKSTVADGPDAIAFAYVNKKITATFQREFGTLELSFANGAWTGRVEHHVLGKVTKTYAIDNLTDDAVSSARLREELIKNRDTWKPNFN